MSVEAGVVLGMNYCPIYWHTPPGASGGSLEDSRDLWVVFWENRHNLSGFAHSHPGRGLPTPSWEDITTFDAVENGLGTRLDWWIISMDSLVLFRYTSNRNYDPVFEIYNDIHPCFENKSAFSGLFWLDTLRKHSNY